MPKSRLVLRLIGGVIGVQAVILSILVWNSSRALDSSHKNIDIWWRAAQEQSVPLRTILAARSAPPDPVALSQVLQEGLRRNHPSLRYAAVFDPRGQQLAAEGEKPPSPAKAQTDAIRIALPLTQEGRPLGAAEFYYSSRGFKTVMDLQNTGLALLGLLLSTGLLLIMTWPLSRNLTGLKTGIHALQQGDLEHRVAVSPTDAVADIAGAVNALAAHLQANRLELRSQHEQLRQEMRRLNNLLHGINAAVWEVDPHSGQFRYVSDEAESLLGYPRSEWLEPDFFKRHVHPSDLDWAQSFLSHTDAGADSFTLDFRIYNKNDECRWLRLISFVELRTEGRVLAGLLLDVTDDKRNEQRIAYLAAHDSLTGLINRDRFQEKLEEHIAYARRYNVTGALLFLDLDQFKYINDTYGHHTGDEYLRQVAHHLRSSLRESDTIGRLGGDEFAIIFPNIVDERADNLGKALRKTLNSKEFIYEGRRNPFSASIGIVLFPKHGDSASDLLAKADSAMYMAKDLGRNTFYVFQEGSAASQMKDKIHWEERIRSALKQNRFQLYFQPIVDIHSGAISHYESLLRMIDEDGKIIPPGAFIGVAERFGLIREIDQWVVANAIRIQGESMQTGKPVAVTINLSGRHFGSPQILETIQEATKQYKAKPSSIVFEVTETAAVENFTDARDFIQELREMRYRFALDDFGAGFSSFDYLKHIPVDYVKIDGSFVRNLHSDKVDQIFVKAIAEMASGLHVKTIAEFVENYKVVEILRNLGVSMGQGYFFAKPAPAFLENDIIALH